MNVYSNDIQTLKTKLKSVSRDKIAQKRLEFALRNSEHCLTEELSVLSAESELMLQQLEELKNQISSLKSQIEMVEICRASEKSKIENQATSFDTHTEAFDVLLKKERESTEIHNKQLREKELEEQEMERLQRTKAIELNEQMGKEAADIEGECEAVERECAVFTKRNRAIMLKLRRKLVETESARRELLKQIEQETGSSDNKK